MIKNYVLYKGTEVQCLTRCDETEIEAYNQDYIEVEEDSLNFTSDKVYTVEDGKLCIKDRIDTDYLISKINNEYSLAVAALKTCEYETWLKQESEAVSYTEDNTSATPFIDSMCEARGCTKEYLGSKHQWALQIKRRYW